MDSVQIKGPFRLRGENSIFDQPEAWVNGFYIRCVQVDPPQSLYRAYYVGEAQNIASRLKVHLKKWLAGAYQAHCLDGLRRNEKILMHRTKYRTKDGIRGGMIPRFSHIDSEKFLNDFVDSMALFFAEIPETGDKKADNLLRKRYEEGIVHHIENAGVNVLNVGRIDCWYGKTSQVRLETSGSEIEALSGEIVSI